MWNGTDFDPAVSEDSDDDGIVDSNTDADADGVADFAKTSYDTDPQNDDIDEYSDLSYEQYQITMGGTYNFTEAFFTKASFTYDIFESDEEFVYGDEDGTAYYGYVGIGFTF